MADNSNNRKKALVISVLAFLLAGGGVFLFFVVQGANDLTGAAKKSTFSYGTAAREGLSSFFKRVGVIEDEEPAAKCGEAIFAAAGFYPDGSPAEADLSDWMAPPAAPAAASSPVAHTAVPKMGGGRLSGAGGAGAGGSKSAGSVSRFGGASATGMTSASGGGKGGGAAASEKGTLGSLKAARSVLGEGLRSNSAMTASSKWGQSFGASSGSGGSGGSLAYNKTGLVSLDKIKSGEIASLKMDKKGNPLVPEANPFKRDAEAEAKDKNLQDAKKSAAEESKKSLKNDLAQTLAQTGADAIDKNSQAAKPDSPTGRAVTPTAPQPVTDAEMQVGEEMTQRINNINFAAADSRLAGYSTKAEEPEATRNPDGGITYKISGEIIPPPPGDKIPYTLVVPRAADGTWGQAKYDPPL